MQYTLEDYNIHIPDELIAQYPLKKRDQSRLLILNIKDNSLKDENFGNIANYLGKNDAIVYNDAKVINARVYANKKETEAKIEVLLTKRVDERDWLCLLRPARRIKPRINLVINRDLSAEVKEIIGEGEFRIRFSKPIDYQELKNIGEIPLPKYIKRRPDKELDEIRYQTVYSKNYGAVASPTAGLHFTRRVLDDIKRKGIPLIPVTLYVDWGTFKPIRERDYRRHKIHKETYEVPEKSATMINQCLKEGKRVICIGTTSVRTIETAVDSNGMIKSGTGETSLYIYPGYRFKFVDGMITNFHLPDSTLILLVSAFAGIDNIKKAYAYAVKNSYRFFSYGDAMFINKF